MKILFIDTETGGLDCKTSALIQMSGIIRIDGKDVDKFNYFIKPFPGSEVNEKALEVQGRTKEEVMGSNYLSEQEIYNDFIGKLDTYIDKFDKTDKFIVAGYNVKFDINFLNEFFRRNGNPYLFSYISGATLDPLSYIPLLQLLNKLPKLRNDKLGTWCEYFNIPLDAHDSFNDIVATKKLIGETVRIIQEG